MHVFIRISAVCGDGNGKERLSNNIKGVKGEVLNLEGPATGGVAGAVKCAVCGVGLVAVCVVNRGGSIDDVFFAVVVGEVSGPQGCGWGSGRLRLRREAADALERSLDGTEE